MKLTVKEAVRGDIPAVVRLLAEMDNEAPMPRTRAERIFRDMSHYPDYRCYVARDGDQPVATFTLLIFEALVHGGSREALLDGVVVTASRRGQGIGRVMIKEAMRLAAAAGCYKLALSSNIKRKDAHRFYESLGFTQHGISFAVASPDSTLAVDGVQRAGLVTE
jgi:GNAT superfamily N-acetyltransferase